MIELFYKVGFFFTHRFFCNEKINNVFYTFSTKMYDTNVNNFTVLSYILVLWHFNQVSQQVGLLTFCNKTVKDMGGKRRMGCRSEEDGRPRDKGGAMWTVLGEDREGERGDRCGFHHQAEDSFHSH